MLSEVRSLADDSEAHFLVWLHRLAVARKNLINKIYDRRDAWDEIDLQQDCSGMDPNGLANARTGADAQLLKAIDLEACPQAIVLKHMQRHSSALSQEAESCANHPALSSFMWEVVQASSAKPFRDGQADT